MTAPQHLTQQIIAMRLAGMRVKDIAAELGCSSANVSATCTKHIGVAPIRVEPLPPKLHRFVAKRASAQRTRVADVARRLLVEAITQAMLEEAS